MTDTEFEAMKSLLINQKVDWDTLFRFFGEKDFSLNDLLMGPQFLRAVKDCYRIRYPEVIFSDFLWTMRSMYLPLFLALKIKLPKADLYHCVATGYAGVLGAMAKQRYGCGLLISEHGIYTREREEELIRAKWVEGIYKNIWIEQFRKMSQLAYDRADKVTSLYEHARELQIELGCPEEKTQVTPNGVDPSRFENLVVLPEMQDEVFTGRINVSEYMGGLDMTILTSISEGQPLTILESYAAHKPVIATDVGNCRGLIYGEDDDFGEAGILTHIMNVEEIADAMIQLATHPNRRKRMGENGYKRLMRKYKVVDMQKTYEQIYWSFEDIEW